MKLFILVCVGCNAEIAFRHPAVTQLPQFEHIEINCPRCLKQITADFDRPVKIHTKVAEVKDKGEVVDLNDYRKSRHGD